jgi:hypothetical protein
MASTPIRVHRLLCALTVALAANVGAPVADAQGLQFVAVDVRGRLDNPTTNEVWVVGDENANGVWDESEWSGATHAANGMAPAGIAYRATDAADPQHADLKGRNEESPFHQINAMYPIVASGTQLMQVAAFATEFDPDRPASTDRVELSYGAKFLSTNSWFEPPYATSDFFRGPNTVETFIESESIGPQLGANWSRRRGAWRLQAGGTVSLSYLNAESTQVGQLGRDLIPGALNQPAVLRPNRFAHESSEWDIAPAAEAGIRLSYDVLPSTVCFVRCDSVFFGNQRSAMDAIVWQLPNMGLTDAPTYNETIVVGSIGVEWIR